jgi:hypothetical protein
MAHKLPNIVIFFSAHHFNLSKGFPFAGAKTENAIINAPETPNKKGKERDVDIGKVMRDAHRKSLTFPQPRIDSVSVPNNARTTLPILLNIITLIQIFDQGLSGNGQ